MLLGSLDILLMNVTLGRPREQGAIKRRPFVLFPAMELTAGELLKS